MTFKRWLIGLMLFLILAGRSFAQNAAQPIILLRTGDLWEWTGGPTLRQKTEWGYNSLLRLSPLNNEVAYSSLPLIVTNALKNQTPPGGDILPSNLWVITTAASDTAFRPADQPVDASFLTPNVADKGLSRSAPIWSPDGSHLAWTEQEFPSGNTYSLVVFDKSTMTSQTIVTGLPQQTGRGAFLEGLWIDKGIVLFSSIVDPSTSQWDTRYLVFDPVSGQKKLDVPIADIVTDDDTLRPQPAIVVEDQGKTYLAMVFIGNGSQWKWRMVDLDTGAIMPAKSIPFALIADHADTSLRVDPMVRTDTHTVQFSVKDANGTPILLNNDPERLMARFALSPDGQAIAYQLYGLESNAPESIIYIWRNGKTISVPQTEYPAIITDFVWGTATWQFEP